MSDNKILCEWLVDKWKDSFGDKRRCYLCPDCLRGSAIKSNYCPHCGKNLKGEDTK